MKSVRFSVCVGVLLCLAIGVCSALASTVDLAGEWRLQGNHLDKVWPIAIPGDVQSALLAAGEMPDPHFGQNEKLTQWVAEREWTISRDFEVSSDFCGAESVILRLDDVDLFCTVFVNGEKVGDTDDRYLRYDFDVKRCLRPGRNEIRGVFRSPLKELDKIVAGRKHRYPTGGGDVRYMTLLRKPPCHGGWDWGLTQMTVGFCGKVELIGSSGPRIDYVYTDQRFSDDLRHCTLRVFADLSNGSVVTNIVEIDDPPLWWPNGMGPQKFYTYDVDVLGRRISRRIGLRKLELDLTGGRMAFKINGVEVFAKGANWIPCDAFATRQTPERYRDLLKSAAMANMNMIRLWGGGQYERDAFYDCCDEMGLMIWHDHAFACGLYPGDEKFLGKVHCEMRHQLKRLRDHASIVLWCGDNECVGSLKWYPESESEPEFYREQMQRRMRMQDLATKEFDSARAFWPSSPCAGPGSYADNWTNDKAGDMHFWQVWFGDKPFDEGSRFKPRFCSEFGYQSYPSADVVETYVSPHDFNVTALDFAYHQKSKGGNKRILERIYDLFRFPSGTEEVIYLSQVQQALAIKTMVEAWRPLRPWCMGTIYWQLDDLWPVTSWSSLDYGGKWKQLHYHARRFYSPVAVVATPSRANTNKVSIVAINDTRTDVSGVVRVRAYAGDGRLLSEEEKACKALAGSATSVDELSRIENGFLVLLFNGFANDYFFSPFKCMPLPAACVKAVASEDDRGWHVDLSTDAPALFVYVEARGVKGEFSDNSFTLLPGEPRRIDFFRKGCAKVDLAAFSRALKIRHLAGIGTVEPATAR